MLSTKPNGARYFRFPSGVALAGEVAFSEGHILRLGPGETLPQALVAITEEIDFERAALSGRAAEYFDAERFETRMRPRPEVPEPTYFNEDGIMTALELTPDEWRDVKPLFPISRFKTGGGALLWDQSDLDQFKARRATLAATLRTLPAGARW